MSANRESKSAAPELVPRFPISSDTEFNQLRSIIVGRAQGANHPDPRDPSFRHFFTPPDDWTVQSKAAGPVPTPIIDEIEQDLEGLCSTLETLGVQVFRPEDFDSSTMIKSPFWETDQLYSLMPRDCMIVIGSTFVETASATRSRYFEVFPFRKIIHAHRRVCSFRWIAAPRPELRDTLFTKSSADARAQRYELSNDEILFDAANCVRVGRDIFIDINLSANQRAAEWLQHDVLGSEYRVHTMHLGQDHADVTLIPIRPGLLLIDPTTVTRETIPEPFKNWDTIAISNPPELPYGLSYPLASSKVGINLLMVNHETAIVEKSQTELCRQLEKRGITPIPLQYRHGRTLGGSFHCVTLDLCREGLGESFI